MKAAAPSINDVFERFTAERRVLLQPLRADRILEGLEGFLGWFVIRKVLGPPETIAAAGPVCAELTRWLVEEGFLRPEAAVGAVELATTAARDLPLAEELSSLLFRSGEGIEHEAVREFVDWESELAEVARIEPGRLWFRSELGELGPVVVPPRATEIVGPGLELQRPVLRSHRSGLVHPGDRERLPGLTWAGRSIA